MLNLLQYLQISVADTLTQGRSVATWIQKPQQTTVGSKHRAMDLRL